jgi:hypothetical protein
MADRAKDPDSGSELQVQMAREAAQDGSGALQGLRIGFVCRFFRLEGANEVYRAVHMWSKNDQSLCWKTKGLWFENQSPTRLSTARSARLSWTFLGGANP